MITASRLSTTTFSQLTIRRRRGEALVRSPCCSVPGRRISVKGNVRENPGSSGAGSCLRSQKADLDETKKRSRGSCAMTEETHAALIVDDDVLVLMVSCAILQDAGYRPFEAADVREALAVMGRTARRSVSSSPMSRCRAAGMAWSWPMTCPSDGRMSPSSSPAVGSRRARMRCPQGRPSCPSRSAPKSSTITCVGRSRLNGVPQRWGRPRSTPDTCGMAPETSSPDGISSL